MRVGIEALNFYAGAASVDIKELFEYRGLDLSRFDNLMIKTKSVGLQCEDPVTNAVNAAKPIIDKLTDSERNRIELLITASESGIDFGKSMSTYIHKYLGLNNACRLFEIKQACYGGTAGLQMAANCIASNVSPGAKALVIASDVAWSAIKGTYGEPSQATGAAALLISDQPDVLNLDFGAYGNYSYEVKDACRPLKKTEIGDPDLSLLSYLDCLQKSYAEYSKKVSGVDFKTTFDYLAFHTPFAGMVQGGHRKMMRTLYRSKGDEAKLDFEKRVLPSLELCMEVGNVYSASLYLALSGLLDSLNLTEEKRIGLYSYGSGCCSEFYSGVIGPQSCRKLQGMGIREEIGHRYKLTMHEYEDILRQNEAWCFGVRGQKVNFEEIRKPYEHFFEGRSKLILVEVDDGFAREYKWS